MPQPCRRILLFAVLLWMAGCRSQGVRLGSLSEEFAYTTLSFSPVTATAAGLHQFGKQDLDSLLDDMGPQGLDKQRRFYEGFRQRLSGIHQDKLSSEEQADFRILTDQIELALLELNEIQNYLHNPTVYVETVGNALFTPLVLEYAPLPQRVQAIVNRMGRLPLFLDQAKNNLVASPPVWTQVALQENSGNFELIDKTIRAKVPTGQRAAYDLAAARALKALMSFEDFLRTSLSARDSWDWRLGREKYAKKFHYVVAISGNPDDLLASAELELPRVRARMLELAKPLHQRFFPAHKDHDNLSGDPLTNLVVSEALARIADRHPTRDSYMPEAKADLEEARQFIAAKHLLTLPSRPNLQVIETPEFMRGGFPVGGFSPAPALEPKLGAFYWITPIPADWPPERVESKLREYNFYKLKLLTVHEAMPGHYVQGEFANDVQPESRRLLRSLYGNGPYVEGWGQYAEQMMLDEGFLGHSPELQLTFLKEELRVLANTILDIRLHIQGMSDQEALDLMEKQTFQEHEEATSKLQRAKLTSAQLPTYYAGWLAWRNVRERYQQARGSNYRLSEFNDRALREGAIPLPLLERLLLGEPAGETSAR
jgi:uncharacterized protein (DUF885 family)